MMDQKQLDSVEYFNCLGSMMQYVHLKLNQELLWQSSIQQNSPANWA
jgi:hypothetical protein